jgi:hypothetical protein
LKIFTFANKYVNDNILRIMQKNLVVQSGNIWIDPKKILYDVTFFLLYAPSKNEKKTLSTYVISGTYHQPAIMHFPWSKSALVRDGATADAASLSLKMTTATNPSVSQQQLGNGAAAAGIGSSAVAGFGGPCRRL